MSHTSLLRRGAALLAVASAVVVPSLAVAGPASAAPTVTTRVASFAAGPAVVVRGKAITVSGQDQRLNGRTWVRTGTVAVTVYFDPDGAKPLAPVRTVRSSPTGAFRTSFTASVSGKWSVRTAAVGVLKGTGTAQTPVRVIVPAPAKPVATGPVNGTCPSWAPIKGNASSHIYHMPWQAFYSRTRPERCFATEAAALREGYRKSKR